jgi:glycosyltransferase involved in cell wall biosynthesis
LRESNIDARFLIAGDPDPGNPDSIEHGELDHWRAEGVVTLLGHVPDMPRLFARCDVAVLPTRYGEGVPRSLIEAAAAGLALIATDVPGCREIVKHGLNGLLVTPGSQEQLNRAIEDLVTDVSGIRRMGRESRKLAVEEFAEDLVVRNTIAVYSD